MTDNSCQLSSLDVEVYAARHCREIGMVIMTYNYMELSPEAGVISSFRMALFRFIVFFRMALFRDEETKWHKPATIPDESNS